MTKTPKILLAGASGLLGCFLGPYLREKGHDVVTQGFRHASAVDFALDASDGEAVRAMLDQVKPQAVVNLVALTDVDACEDDPGVAWRLNVHSVETIADWISGRDDCHLVQVSTDHVYDGPGPHAENDVDVVNVYALSKYAGELAALRAEATVLRTNFFGPSMHAERRSFSDWILAKLRAGEAFTGFEDVSFSPLSMATLSAAIERVIARPKRGVFNLGSRQGVSKAEFARLIAGEFGLDASLVRAGSQADAKLRARRPTDMRMDSRLFESEFDFILPDTRTEISGLETKHA